MDLKSQSCDAQLAKTSDSPAMVKSDIYEKHPYYAKVPARHFYIQSIHFSLATIHAIKAFQRSNEKDVRVKQKSG